MNKGHGADDISSTVRVFFDTEFTQIAEDGELISIGLAADNGDTLYLEVDQQGTTTYSPFVQEFVLPLLEGGQAQCSRADLIQRIEYWLIGLDQPVEMYSDSDWDWYMLRKAIGGVGRRDSCPITIGWITVSLHLLEPPAGSVGEIFRETYQTYFLRNKKKQHHALADAMALRAAMQAYEHQQSISKR